MVRSVSKTKKLVFDSVLSFLEEEAALDLTVARVKVMTGLSTGTIYYHFPKGIEDIYGYVFKSLAENLKTVLSAEVKESQCFKNTLHITLSRYFKWHDKNKRESNFFYKVNRAGLKSIDDLLDEEFSVLTRSVYSKLNELAKKEGKHLVEPFILDAVLFGASRELIHGWIKRGRKRGELKIILEEFLEIALRISVKG
jgi:AcrR family transcriptional regulator